MHGQCMCGAVDFTVDGEVRPVVNCHCHRCRRWSGHYWAATNARVDHLHVADTTTLRWYSPADGIEYGFCGTCGSSLFWRLADRPDLISFSAGCLDLPTGLTTSHSLWMAEHADYHEPLAGPEALEYE
jgi:hypothetical protein